jgi:hypothetical protein
MLFMRTKLARVVVLHSWVAGVSLVPSRDGLRNSLALTFNGTT